LDSGTRIEDKYGPTIAEADFKDDPDFADFAHPEFEPSEDVKVAPAQMPDIDDVDDVDTYDQYVGDQVRFPIGDDVRYGKVMQRKRSLDGTVKGCANDNVIMDTRTYEVEFPDGLNDEYTANVIAENMYAQCDEAGNQFNMMEVIVDNKTDGHAVDRADISSVMEAINKSARQPRVGTCALNGKT
jgi:predicted transcriptional regulator